MPSGRCSASIWLVILSRWRSSAEKSGPAGVAGAGMAGAIGGALIGGSDRGGPSSSFWRAVISAIAESNEIGLGGGEAR